MQEALTNVSRHARPAGVAGGRVCATVHLHYTPDGLEILVDDDGLSLDLTHANGNGSVGAGTASANGSGLGLIGMRERVAALGGRLQAGPRDDGGFRVAAEIPARVART